MYFLIIICAVVGGYFLADRSGLLPDGKIEYIKSIEEIKEDQKVEIVAEQKTVQDQTVQDEKKELEIVAQDEKAAATPVQEEKIEEKIVEEKESDEEKETNGEVGKIVDKLMSGGFQKSSGRDIDTIIVHSSYDALGSDPYSISGIIKEYEQYGVSAHYLIGRDGIIYRLVKDENIAWHAGVSTMPDGRTNVNNFSIGVEMVNKMDGKYTSEQYEALNILIGSLKKKYPIENILGHDDIAPDRKTDPWGIEWEKVKK